MTTPLPLIKQNQAADILANAYIELDNSRSDPASQPPCLLLVLSPAWNNRYQSLLYAEARPRRYAVLGLTETNALQHVSWPGPIILHAHWFSAFFNECRDEIDAAERLARIQDDILEFRHRTGARLLWTAHNVFPHGNPFPETFLMLRQWLFEVFDALHVMQDAHVLALEQAFERSAPPHFTVPHMLYTGSHPDCVSAAAAKAHYGIAPDAFVFAAFGSIQTYKKLESMLTAFERIAANSARSIAAVIGGVPSEIEAVLRLEQGWGLNPRVRLLMRPIPDYEIQHIHRAADVMVLPYGDTLNSGSAFMAASFERPFIMPAGLAAKALEGLGVSSFDAGEPDALEAAMRAAMTGARGPINPSIQAACSGLAVSKAFFNALDELIAQPQTAQEVACA
jgi:glycosyltransferase involved in cell wall biosynthesis